MRVVYYLIIFYDVNYFCNEKNGIVFRNDKSIFIRFRVIFGRVFWEFKEKKCIKKVGRRYIMCF